VDCASDDDDDDDYDVPPAFQINFNDVARLSCVAETDTRATTTDGYDADSREDDDDDYDVPPAFRLDTRDVARLLAVAENGTEYGRNICDDRNDDNYDVIPCSLRPTMFDDGRSLTRDARELLTTAGELMPLELADNNDVYDYIPHSEGGSACVGSDDAVQRTSTIDPDDIYDYIGTYGETEGQLEDFLISGDSERAGINYATERTASDDTCYDYLPLRSSRESDVSYNCAVVCKQKLSSSDEHYDVLPSSRPTSSLVEHRSVSDSTPRSSALTLDSSSDEDSYDLRDGGATGSAFSDTITVNFEESGTLRNSGSAGPRVSPEIFINNRKQPSPSLSYEDDDVLTCRATLSSPYNSKLFDALTASTSSVPPPTSACSTLTASVPDKDRSSGQTFEQTTDTTCSTVVTQRAVITSVLSDQLDSHGRLINSAKNEPPSKSKLNIQSISDKMFNLMIRNNLSARREWWFGS